MGFLKNVWSAIIQTIETVINAVEYFVGRIFENPPRNSTSRHNTGYALREVDKQYIKDSAAKLKEILGENPAEALLAMDVSERYYAVDALTSALVELYNLEDIEIEFKELDIKTCGYYNSREHKIVLNIYHMLTDNYDITKDFLDTIFHEFRHAVQWKIARNSSHPLYDEEFASNIIRNINNYVSPGKNMRAYHNQFMEVDAREIAMYILEA